MMCLFDILRKAWCEWVKHRGLTLCITILSLSEEVIFRRTTVKMLTLTRWTAFFRANNPRRWRNLNFFQSRKLSFCFLMFIEWSELAAVKRIQCKRTYFRRLTEFRRDFACQRCGLALCCVGWPLCRALSALWATTRWWLRWRKFPAAPNDQ